jgi:murein DD-endopeptidase MepM/ murein hydrolase activator NlpD
MRVQHLVLLALIALSLRTTQTAVTTEPFEIRFSPTNFIYRVTLNEEERLYDCVIQNLAVINRTTAPLLLQRIELQLISKGEVVETRVIRGPDLEARAQRIFTLRESGTLNEAEKEFRLNELFRDAQLSRSNRLEPNQGILIRHQYLQFSGDVEKIRVVAVGGADKATQSAIEIAVVTYQQKTKFSFPLNGTWYVSNDPNPSRTHRWGISQEFAYDFERLDSEGNPGKGDETKPESYYAYGQEVLAAADGTVSEVRDGIDDTPIAQFAVDPATMMKRLREYQTKLRQQYGPRGADGNRIVIDHGNGEFSVMVHLKKNSIRVKRGDRVRQGQVIAQVGQSGLSTNPHLHFEVVSDPDPFKQRGLPVLFYGLEDEEGPKFLRFGEFVRRGTP